MKFKLRSRDRLGRADEDCDLTYSPAALQQEGRSQNEALRLPPISRSDHQHSVTKPFFKSSGKGSRRFPPPSVRDWTVCTANEPGPEVTKPFGRARRFFFHGICDFHFRDSIGLLGGIGRVNPRSHG